MKEYRTICTDYTSELDIQKSRFICTLKRVNSEEEARTIIASLKKEHYRASHNCSAFIIGENASVKRSSDDGEPSGTAGIPMLSILEKQKLVNVVAVVTRYFGGIKLGTGGLIRAYTGAVAQTIEKAGLVCVKEQQSIQLQLSYAQYQDFLIWCADKQLVAYHTSFLELVTTTIYVEPESITTIQKELDNIFLGKASFQLGTPRMVEVPLA